LVCKNWRSVTSVVEHPLSVPGPVTLANQGLQVQPCVRGSSTSALDAFQTRAAAGLAEGMLANPDDPVPVASTRFPKWRKTAKDVGRTIAAALSAFRGDWVAASEITPQAHPPRD
jgi:hypothetical protein